MKIKMFMFLYFCALLLISVVAIELSKNEKQSGEAKESKTNIEVDGKVRWSGGRATWRSGSGNQNEGHNSIINYSDNGKAGNNENQGSGGSGDSGGNRNLGCMSNVHGEKL
ncbi:uncharacterized protein [Medicago truncatula]|uniref:Nodule-specific Glycine Rich Peptide n=1 Tax=Medicago truncatula TaxID=3880 RepID=A7KHH7_MEDTR|nr:uncharacterized protein LOC11423092 [Medicago truncatula]ABS31484.1 nodule-specific glycine-rich protein 1J [Medicago truncatula]AES99783.1 Nodule-specific Glycine Rich Peptide [Medicago truncatula]